MFSPKQLYFNIRAVIRRHLFLELMVASCLALFVSIPTTWLALTLAGLAFTQTSLLITTVITFFVSPPIAFFVGKQQKQLKKQNQQLEQLAFNDSLTNIKNRRAFELLFPNVAAQNTRQKKGFVVCLVDIDHFKKINDTYGHQAGDQALIEMANILCNNVRQSDLAARYGGEEFVLLLSCTSFNDAQTKLEKLLLTVEQHRFEFNQTEHRMTVSGGFAYCESKVDYTAVIKMADAALYSAKEQGRNRVVGCSMIGSPEGTRAA